MSKVATSSDGYLGADLEQLVDRSIDAAYVRFLKEPHQPFDIPQLSIEDFTEAQKGFVPISLKGIQLHTSDVEWQDIGGLNEVRKTLKETLEWPSKYPKLFENIPLRPRSGYALNYHTC